MLEVFNLFNVTNILGTTNVNYSGFANVLTRDSDDPASPDYLTSSRFGTPVTTAGGVFGSGGPARASTRCEGDLLSTIASPRPPRSPRSGGMGTWAATALVVSEVVGVGILLTPATMMRSLGGTWAPLGHVARDRRR